MHHWAQYLHHLIILEQVNNIRVMGFGGWSLVLTTDKCVKFHCNAIRLLQYDKINIQCIF